MRLVFLSIFASELVEMCRVRKSTVIVKVSHVLDDRIAFVKSRERAGRFACQMPYNALTYNT